MSKKDSLEHKLLQEGKYEYRVWGKHRKAARKIERLASHEYFEHVEDCYLLQDDPEWNVKVRNDTLKLKQLVTHERGFQVWHSDCPQDAASAPEPFDQFFADLSLDRAQQDKKYDLTEAVGDLDSDDATAVFVTKHRTRYRIGSLRAEVSRILVHDSPTRLRTIAIEGTTLKGLRKLLRQLGLDREPNVPFHLALEDALEER